MLKCDQPERPKKTYTIPKVSKKRQAAIDAGTWQPKPKQPIKANPNTKIKPRSEKRARQEREYSILRDEHLKNNPTCLLCDAPATEIHHPEGRIGYRLTDAKNFKQLCHDHHVFVELNPIEAKKLNLSYNRL